ncbi:hypothetical protein [Streptomyces sp. NPDC088760]|uniref:hypothetical protein n=1 Tax=Streptomyces sp. NPDC088760 TaxID=3365890 RepID=UPI0037F321E7
MGELIRLRCEGDGSGKRFLCGNIETGHVSLKSGTAVGTKWLMVPTGGTNEFKFLCTEVFIPDFLITSTFDQPVYLDGNIFNGEVKLVNTTEPPFTGTRWFKAEGGESTSFTCLGAGGEADAPRLLDGWVGMGTVQLRQAAAIFTGTKWTVVNV